MAGGHGMTDIGSTQGPTRLRDQIWAPRPWTMSALQALGVLAAAWAIWFGAGWGWWALSLAVYFLTTCLGMALCVHRAMTHRAFTLARPVERLFSLFAALGGTGSPVGWIAVHRAHHATADTEADPHGPGAHGWALLFGAAVDRVDWWRVRDVLRDPYQRVLHSHYTMILVGWAGVLALIHPLALVFGFLTPAAAQITVTHLSTILGHGWGYRNFPTRDESTNNVLITVLTWGEGWHNNHHARPRHWTMQATRWEVDPTAWAVLALSAAGLAKGGSLGEPGAPPPTDGGGAGVSRGS